MNAEGVLEHPETAKDVRSRAQLCERERECENAHGVAIAVVEGTKRADERVVHYTHERKRQAGLAHAAVSARR